MRIRTELSRYSTERHIRQSTSPGFHMQPRKVSASLVSNCFLLPTFFPNVFCWQVVRVKASVTVTISFVWAGCRGAGKDCVHNTFVLVSLDCWWKFCGLVFEGIMNRCRSQIGAKMLRIWFQRPTRHLQVLKDRQDAIAFFCCARNFEVTSTLSDCLKNIKNISVSLQYLQ